MSVQSLSLIGPNVPPTEPPSGSVSGTGQFGNLMERFLGAAGNSHQAANEGVRDLVTGRTENMHGVLMQVAQADLNFRLILEIRNRLIESYQEVMKIQV